MPQVGSWHRGHKDSLSSSSSSLSTRSSTSTIKQFKQAQLAEKKAVEEAVCLSGEPTTRTPRHLVSHMLPYFYPNDDYSCDAADNDDTNVKVPRHLVSHVTTYCYPVTGTVDDEDVQAPRPDVVPPHLESHVATNCRPMNDDGAVIEWPTDTHIGESTRPKLAKPQRTNFVPRHLRSHFDNDDSVDGDGETEYRPRTGICCQMTRDHANMVDNLFPDDDKPVRRVGGRRPVVNHRNLFEESKPKPRPMSITIVQRDPENTKENIFGMESSTRIRPRRRWENDTMKTIFGHEVDAMETSTPTPRSRKHEDTTEKLFGERYGIKEMEEQNARRQRPLREDTHMTLFGPPTASTPQRPQSARSLTSTHENIFGPLTPSESRRRTLHRENTFNNLFGATPTRSVTATGTSERYTPKTPKIVQASLSSVKLCR